MSDEKSQQIQQFAYSEVKEYIANLREQRFPRVWESLTARTPTGRWLTAETLRKYCVGACSKTFVQPDGSSRAEDCVVLPWISLRGGAPVHAIAHITGGGITENLNRALASNVDAVVDRAADGSFAWDVPPVISYVCKQAQLTPNEACKTFNMGVGLMIICAPEDEAEVAAALEAVGEKPFRVGTCVPGSGKVVYADEQ